MGRGVTFYSHHRHHDHQHTFFHFDTSNTFDPFELTFTFLYSFLPIKHDYACCSTSHTHFCNLSIAIKHCPISYFGIGVAMCVRIMTGGVTFSRLL